MCNTERRREIGTLQIGTILIRASRVPRKIGTLLLLRAARAGKDSITSLSSKAQALLQAAGSETSSFVLVPLSKIGTLLLASLGGKEENQELSCLPQKCRFQGARTKSSVPANKRGNLVSPFPSGILKATLCHPGNCSWCFRWRMRRSHKPSSSSAYERDGWVLLKIPLGDIDGVGEVT